MQHTSVMTVSDLRRSPTPLEEPALRAATPCFLAQKVLGSARRAFEDCTAELFLSLLCVTSLMHSEY